MFKTVNRYSTLALNDNAINEEHSENPRNENKTNDNTSEVKVKSSTPIIIGGIQDFDGLRTTLTSNRF